tara:strand:+ start:1455 stop:2531 length:1077 start_codon:yes stop_codon:yes gene_type:complete
MEKRMEKISTFEKDFKNGFDIEVILNPELLDGYFYSEKEKVKHHMCLIKDYIEDYSLFITLIELNKVHSDYLITKKVNEPCVGCMLDCANQIHPTFNFACYFIILNIELRGNSVHRQDKNTLIINCLNLFSVKDEILVFDFEKMTRYFKEYDIKKIKSNLLAGKPIDNLDFLNKLSDLINEFDDEISIFSDEPTVKCSVMRVIENKEKYYNKKIAIDGLREKSKGSNSISSENSTPICNLEKTKPETILKKLNQYGFSELETLKDIDIKSLVEHIFTNTKAPYQIAYLSYLGFIEKIDTEYCDSQKDLHKLLEKIIGVNERAVRGNINGINQKISKDRKRYTAYKHIEKVKEHYQTLK